MDIRRVEQVIMILDSFGSNLGVGGIRSESLANALSARGVTVKVLVRRPPLTSAVESPLFKKSLKSYIARELVGVLPRFTPDVSMTKWSPLISEIEANLVEAPDSLVYSSGPPHSIHVAVGRAKGSQTWIADLRDPFDFNLWRRWSRATRSLDAAEEAVCANADFVLTVSVSHGEELRRRYPSTNVVAVEHGFPDEMLPLRVATAERTGPCRIGLVGTVRTRYFERLMDILGPVAAALGEIEIVYYGAFAESLQRFEPPIGVTITPHPHVLQAEAIAGLKECSLLVNARGGRMFSFSSKYYEFVALGLPILAIGANDEEAAWLAAVPQAIVDDLSDDASAVASAVIERLENYEPQQAQEWLDAHGAAFSRSARWQPFLDARFEFPDTDKPGSVSLHQLGRG